MSGRSGTHSQSLWKLQSRRCTSFPIRPDPAPGRPERTPCPRLSREIAASVCASSLTSRPSAAGGKRSAGRTSCSSIAPGSATATTTRRGSSRHPWASSCTCAGGRSPTQGSCQRDERRLHLLQDRSRRAARGRGQPDGRLHRHRGHRSEGRCASPRPPRAPSGNLSRRLSDGRGGGEADGRFRRGNGESCGAGRVPADGLRRPGRRADGLPPALAHPRRALPWDAGMTLIARIEDELKDAMKERDGDRRDALRLILNALRTAEKEIQRPLHEDEELQVLQRQRENRLGADEAHRAAGREEQAEKEEDELDVLEEFMPEPLSEDELEAIVDDAIAENGATSLRDLGRVMADVMPQIAGRADGSAVSQIVREKLA